MILEDQRHKLGMFLRAHRLRTMPEAVGLPATSRRRTQGLRREELALLAGMSATWYTRIEQGRDVSASHAAISRLADALHLDRAARRHLFELSGHVEPASTIGRAKAIPPPLVEIVEVLSEPAYVLDSTWTACAWNESAAVLFADWLGGADHNLLRYVFLDTRARHFVADWEVRARRLLAEFRADTAGRAEEAEIARLITELRKDCAFFGRWWDEQQVMSREGGDRTFNHPDGTVLICESTDIGSDV